MMKFFDTHIIETKEGGLVGPFRTPRQMLASQHYDGHDSIHDDNTAQKLGFQGGTIEGPTHFSQFDPLAVKLFGSAWFERGCISAHYRNPVFEGDKVRAIVDQVKLGGSSIATIRMEGEDGTEVLRGTISIGPDHSRTALEKRLAELLPLESPRILADVSLGMRTKRQPIQMDFNQNMGALYPFTLQEKLEVITEPSSIYQASRSSRQWEGAVIPFEMLSVLFCYTNKEDPFPVRGPVVGLFADQEIRLLNGPIFANQPYEIEREVIALSGSRRTESMWVRSIVYPAGSDEAAATMLLNMASLKQSYDGYNELPN